MDQKSALYTKTGDKGETSLVSGNRLPKSDLRIDLYGEVDELNSHLGIVLAQLNQCNVTLKDEILALGQQVQSNLFNLGSFLACEPEHWESYKLTPLNKDLITETEKLIDKLDSKIPKLKNFILPGGSLVSSYTHVARTVCRRVERKLVEFKYSDQQIPENSLEFLNRLSDFLFVMARYCNLESGVEEIIWTN